MRPFAMCFFFNDTATTEIYTLSLHDALPISRMRTTMGTARAAGADVFVERTAHEKEGSLAMQIDRKSTRLNSSHANISYAVFCLKKKQPKAGRRSEVHMYAIQ